jgi:hypothetical protein
MLEEVWSEISFQDSDFSIITFKGSTGLYLSLAYSELTSGYYLYVLAISVLELAQNYKWVLDKSSDKTYLLLRMVLLAYSLIQKTCALKHTQCVDAIEPLALN